MLLVNDLNSIEVIGNPLAKQLARADLQFPNGLLQTSHQ
jgi:hypothetical protein